MARGLPDAPSASRKRKPAWGTGVAFCPTCKVWWAKRSHGWAQRVCPACRATLRDDVPPPEAPEEIRPGVIAQWREDS